MKKQTKNIITREFVENELRFYNKADIRSTLVLYGTLSVFFVPLAAGLIYGILSQAGYPVLKIFLVAVIGGLFGFPVWCGIFLLCRSLKERKLLLNGEFEIEIHTVTHKKEKVVHKHIEEFLRFKGFKDVSVGHTVFQLASPGDEFYLIHYRSKKLIKLLYPTKMYEYKESRNGTFLPC